MMEKAAGIAKNKYFLYVTAFFSGMAVMAIELGASRLLAPYFSSSQIVWTVIIGTIMIALAVGNVIGGRMADRDPDPAKLYLRLLVAAIWTAAIPFLGKYVIAAVSLILASFVTTNFLVWASLVSCFLIFVFPLVLLGTAAPSLIKFSVQSLAENGKVVGELEALNTIGSIIGTFVPTFVTIPTVGTSATFLIFAAILAIISLLYFLSAGRYRIRGILSAVIITVLVFVPFPYSFAFWEKDLTYEGESVYNYLQVKEDSRRVILSTNVMVGVQSVLMKDRKLTGMYYDYALAAPMLAGLPVKGEGAGTEAAEEKNVLVLGLGTGTFAKQCLEFFDGAAVEGVEIDERITELARAYFDLPEEIKVYVNDGRAFLQNSGKYDVIMVDAYQDITIPFQMSSTEFFSMVRDHLTDEGVMVVNLNMRSDKEGSINEYLCDTIESVFGGLFRASVDGNTNAVLFAAKDGTRDLPAELAVQSGMLGSENQLRSLMDMVAKKMETVSGGERILTDDKAPVELLGMRVIDELIGSSLAEFRAAFEEALKTGDWSGLTQGF